MFSISWIKTQEMTQSLNKTNLSAIICCGKTKFSDKECCLKDEINWLQKNKTSRFENYRAVLCHPAEDNINKHDFPGISVPPIIINKPVSQLGTVNPTIMPDSIIPPGQLNNSKIFMACSVRKTTVKKTEINPPYTFHDRSRNVYYSMLIDNEPDDVNLFFRLSGFVDWLSLYKPELLFSKEANNSEYLFYWLIKNIQEANHDVLNGLYKGLNTTSNQNIGGPFNLLFSDGSGVYAYSWKSDSVKQGKTISFRINRNEHNIFSYVLRNSSEHDDLDWIHLKANSLYYFPPRGALQNYLNIDIPSRAEVKLKKCMYWTCLSLMSSNLV
jgi:hypothetical protein